MLIIWINFKVGRYRTEIAKRGDWKFEWLYKQLYLKYITKKNLIQYWLEMFIWMLKIGHNSQY